MASGFVEAVAEGSVGTCQGPIWGSPRIGLLSEAVNSGSGFQETAGLRLQDPIVRSDCQSRWLSSGEERAHGAQNLRANRGEVFFPE
jgi:hypothetical protein